MENNNLNTRFKIHYDNKFDILYVYFVNYECDKFGDETDDGLIYMRDISNNQCVGINVIDFIEKYNKNNLPVFSSEVPEYITYDKIFAALKNASNNNYTLIFLFNTTNNKVLLVYKTKGPYPNLYNGIGGKIELGECALEGAIRETYEETNVRIRNRLKYLSLCRPTPNVGLHVFYANVNEFEVVQKEDEPLKWFDLNTLENYSKQFVSDVMNYINAIKFLLMKGDN